MNLKALTLSALLGAVLTVGLMTGCSAPPAENATPAAEEAAENAAPAAAEEAAENAAPAAAEEAAEEAAPAAAEEAAPAAKE